MSLKKTLSFCFLLSFLTLGCQSNSIQVAPPTGATSPVTVLPTAGTALPTPEEARATHYLAEDGSEVRIRIVMPPKPKPSPAAPIPLGEPPIDFSKHEWANFSQAGEDGVLEAIFQVIEPTNKYVIEFGASEGLELCNARHLIANRGWNGLLLEGDEDMAKKLADNFKQYPNVKTDQAWIYPGNVETLFERYGAPKDPDVLSIDIDSNDYYIWKVLNEFRPKIVVIEYNASFPPPEKMVVEFSPFNYWDRSDFYGASLQSLCDLGKKKGYELLYCTDAGTNAIFVDGKYFDRFKIKDNSPKTLYKLPKYGIRGAGLAPNGLGHPSSENLTLVVGDKQKPAFKPTLNWDAMEIPKIRRTDF